MQDPARVTAPPTNKATGQAAWRRWMFYFAVVSGVLGILLVMAEPAWLSRDVVILLLVLSGLSFVPAVLNYLNARLRPDVCTYPMEAGCVYILTNAYGKLEMFVTIANRGGLKAIHNDRLIPIWAPPAVHRSVWAASDEYELGARPACIPFRCECDTQEGKRVSCSGEVVCGFTASNVDEHVHANLVEQAEAFYQRVVQEVLQECQQILHGLVYECKNAEVYRRREYLQVTLRERIGAWIDWRFREWGIVLAADERAVRLQLAVKPTARGKSGGAPGTLYVRAADDDLPPVD